MKWFTSKYSEGRNGWGHRWNTIAHELINVDIGYVEIQYTIFFPFLCLKFFIIKKNMNSPWEITFHQGVSGGRGRGAQRPTLMSRTFRACWKHRHHATRSFEIQPGWPSPRTTVTQGVSRPHSVSSWSFITERLSENTANSCTSTRGTYLNICKLYAQRAWASKFLQCIFGAKSLKSNCIKER